MRHRVILAQEVAGAVAVVFESMKLGQHEEAFHDHCLETRFCESKVVGTGEAGARAR